MYSVVCTALLMFGGLCWLSGRVKKLHRLWPLGVSQLYSIFLHVWCCTLLVAATCSVKCACQCGGAHTPGGVQARQHIHHRPAESKLPRGVKRIGLDISPLLHYMRLQFAQCRHPTSLTTWVPVFSFGPCGAVLIKWICQQGE